tara:strand:+ start:6038 stop:6526 length:489 start_codon:yes stop_codon:yes gene_type:complete
MFGMFSALKGIMVMGLVAGIMGGAYKVYAIVNDNAKLKANQVVLEQSIETQKGVIEQYKKDMVEIVKANNEMNLLIKNLQKDFEDLDKRFTKKNRDIGKIAEKKPEAFEKILNNAGKNANRCMEIASGSPLTDEEKNATRKSQINPECPSIANPNYVPYGIN